MNWSGCQSTGAERRKYFTVAGKHADGTGREAQVTNGYRLAAERLAHHEADFAGLHWKA